MEIQSNITHGKTINRSKLDAPNTIAFGIGKAVQAVPEWHAKQFMKVYDKLYYDKLSKDEKKVAKNLRPIIEKRARALGWLATGAEVAIITLGIAKGYQRFKKKIGQGVPSVEVHPVVNPSSVKSQPYEEKVISEILSERKNRPFEGALEVKSVSHGEGPILMFKGTRVDMANDITEAHAYRREYPIDFEFAIHQLEGDRVIINIPGYGGSLNGYEHKYAKLAGYMQRQGLGAVLRSDNGVPYTFLPDAKARAAIEYVLTNAQMICGTNKPDIFMIGTSAGAGAIAAIAHEYPQIKRLLLLAPSFDMPKDMVAAGLEKFTGEVMIMRGAQDKVLGPSGGQIYLDMAKNASRKQLFTLPQCGHYFEGKANGRILSQAPFFAFAKGERPVFPDPNAGIVLYK